jgi:hypothetical protein
MYHPLALRMFLLGTHYRSPINYTIEQLNVASDRLYYTYQVCFAYILLFLIQRCVYEPLARQPFADAIPYIFFWQENELGGE